MAQSLGLSWNSVLKTEDDGTQTLINSDEVNSPSRLNMRAEVNQLTVTRPDHLIRCSSQVKAGQKRLTLLLRKPGRGTPVDTSLVPSYVIG